MFSPAHFRHEMLNEINCDEVQACLLNWISSLVQKPHEQDAGDSSEHLLQLQMQ